MLGVLTVLWYSLASRISTSWISIENSSGQKVCIQISHILWRQLSFSIIFFLTVKQDKLFEMTKWEENQCWEGVEGKIGLCLISFDPVWLPFTFASTSRPGVLFRFSIWTSLTCSFVNSEACKWWKDYIFDRSNLRQFSELKKKLCSIACSKLGKLNQLMSGEEERVCVRNLCKASANRYFSI